MQMVLVYLCLLGTVLSAPVPLPGRPAANCIGQHRILLKGCNSKHGFYVFKYIYFSTQRNQTQIKKEETNSQTTIPARLLDGDKAGWRPTENGAAPEEAGSVSADVMESRTGLKPGNGSTLGAGGDARGPHLGTSMRARSRAGTTGPTPDSLEGSGDLDLVVEVDDGVSAAPQGRRISEAMLGNRSSVRSEDRDDGVRSEDRDDGVRSEDRDDGVRSEDRDDGVRSEDRDDGSPKGVPVELAMTTRRERARATVRAGDEGSGEATVLGQGQEGIMQGTGTGAATRGSVSEKMEDVQVDTRGVDEYAYISNADSITVPRGNVGSASFTQISPDKDDEVNIFIGKASIHVGEQEATQAGSAVGSEADSIPSAGTNSPAPRLDFTVAHNGNDDDGDDGISAHRRPEGLATTVIPSDRDSINSSPGDDRLTGEDEDATTTGYGERPVAPSPWKAAGGAVTVPVVTRSRGSSDDEVRGEEQSSKGRPIHLTVTTPHQETTATVPAKGVSIHLDTTGDSLGVSEGDCTTALGTARGHSASKSTMVSRDGSEEVRPVSPKPREGGRPGTGVRVQPGAARVDKTGKIHKAPSPHGKVGSRVSGTNQAVASGHGGTAGTRLRPTEAEGSPTVQTGQTRDNVAAHRGQTWGRGSGVGTAAAGGTRLPGHRGRRPESTVPGVLAAGRSRQVDQVKRADELHVRERAFYSLGRAGNGPRGRRYTNLGSADSSQSSEGEQGSLSDSRQTGMQPSAWGAPGHPHGYWSQGPL